MTEGTETIFGLSAGFGIFAIAVSILWFLLCVILFFKIWAMTNDIRDIRDKMEEWLDLEHPEVEKEGVTDSK